MFKFYNPHPQQKSVGDCVKRAITCASGKTYQEVSKELNRIKREIGASAYNVNAVWNKYLQNDLHARYESYPAVKGQSRMNGHRFCESHPTGTYVLSMAGHLTCCKDGVIHDTWDCRDKCVYSSYELPAESADTYDGDECGGVCDGYNDSDNSYVRKCASPAPDEHPTGNEIIGMCASLVGADEIKKTKSGELWISLDAESYDKVSRALARYKLHNWKESGRTKVIITDPENGMELILKKGAHPYLWCTVSSR